MSGANNIGLNNLTKIRVDKWLWAARFFKTRSLASKAVSGGKIHCNGARLKPAREVKIGDELSVQKGDYKFIVIVKGVNNKRRPAREAVLLYEETCDSIKNRQEIRSDKKVKNEFMSQFGSLKKPSKKDRRLIRSFTRQD